jgi:hypothetical protein
VPEGAPEAEQMDGFMTNQTEARIVTRDEMKGIEL